jgi:hypothetical protein
MTARRRLYLVVTAVFLTALFSLPAWAVDLSAGDSARKIVVVGDDGDEIVIHLAHVEEIVHEALAGLGDVMEELEDMQLQVRMGRENRLDLSYDDTIVELDIDQIMAQVSDALEVGLSGFDTDAWTDSHHRWDDVTDDDLQAELESLRDEMRELRAELRKLREMKAE